MQITMKGASWLLVVAVVLVIGEQLARRHESPEIRALRAGLEEAPLTPAQKEQVIEGFEHRDDPSLPMDVTDTVLTGARYHRLLRPGRLRVQVGLHEGAFLVFDASRLEAWTPELWERSMEAMFASPQGVGVFGGVVTVSGCQGGPDPLDVHLTDDGPTLASPGATRFDLDLPSGRLAVEDNGDGTVHSVIKMPPGRYRARLTVTGAARCADQRFTLDLWPRS